MSYKINYIVTSEMLKVTITGMGGSKNMKNISADIRGLIGKYHLKKILVDSSQTDGQIGIFESIEHIENYPPEMRELKGAVISRVENKAQNSFFENAAVNRGFQIYFFYDEEEALKWLGVTEEEPELVMEREY